MTVLGHLCPNGVYVCEPCREDAGDLPGQSCRPVESCDEDALDLECNRCGWTLRRIHEEAEADRAERWWVAA